MLPQHEVGEQRPWEVVAVTAWAEVAAKQSGGAVKQNDHLASGIAVLDPDARREDQRLTA